MERLIHGERETNVQLPAGRVAAQEHAGENIGQTESHSIFVELKEPNAAASDGTPELGPSNGT